MNSHYIPCLLLRQFAQNGKVNTFDFKSQTFMTKKIQKTFAEKDLFDADLEQAFSKQIEGPLGDLLNHKLLHKDRIEINRSENFLMRKFIMLNNLRAPIVNKTWEEMVELTKTKDHPSIQMTEYFKKYVKGAQDAFEEMMSHKKTYFSNLRTLIEAESLRKLAEESEAKGNSKVLSYSAQNMIVTPIAFWDCEDTGQEFILPKLPGISQMDYRGIFYKISVPEGLRTKKKMTALEEQIFNRLLSGSILFSDNFSMHPISPTRMIVRFSPYFRGFFPENDVLRPNLCFAPLLEKKQFQNHFFNKTRMTLFEPCSTYWNLKYEYSVKKLTKTETMELNSILLDMETDEMVFHDFNKIRDSLWFYDHVVKLAWGKKHNFSRFE